MTKLCTINRRKRCTKKEREEKSDSEGEAKRKVVERAVKVLLWPTHIQRIRYYNLHDVTTVTAFTHPTFFVPLLSFRASSSVIINIKMQAEFLNDKSGGREKWWAACLWEYQSAGPTRCLLPICIKIEEHRKLYRNASVRSFGIHRYFEATDWIRSRP